MKAKARRAGAKVVTPEELWHESGLSREEWNRRLAEKAEAAEAEREGAGLQYVLMMIDTDGKSVMTKLAERALIELATEAHSTQAGSNQGSNQFGSNQADDEGAGRDAA